MKTGGFVISRADCSWKFSMHCVTIIFSIFSEEIPKQNISMEQESGYSYFTEIDPSEWSLIGFLEWKWKSSTHLMYRSKEHSAFKSFLQNIVNDKKNTNAQRAQKLLDNWKGIKCSLEVEKFWDSHKKIQDLRQDIQHVKMYNELKLFQIESEDAIFLLFPVQMSLF
ncbi:hypothetical protein C1646_477675 [Rhizophagus diaphanus]|nr:hypothetical protein C1646_477675 [Rhizophagus diaphanus] [Rhizophagus sp. MUCL 43196]